MLTLFFCLFLRQIHADAWDDVFKQAGLTREQIHFDPLDVQQSGGADLQMPYFKVLHGDPLRIPYYSRLYRGVLLDSASEPFKAGTSALLRVGTGVRRNLEGDPLAEAAKLAKEPDGLEKSLAQLHKLGGHPLRAQETAEIRKRAKSLRPEVREQIAFLLASEAHAFEWRQRALRLLDKPFLRQAWQERIQPPKREDQEDHNGLTPVQRRLLRDVDMPVLMSGGLDLLLAVQQVRLKLKDLTAHDQFEWDTPLGRVIVRGGETNDLYPGDKPYLLIVDGGGDDTYLGGGASFDLDHPIGVLIDLKGNDKYLGKAGLTAIAGQSERGSPKQAPSFGAGVFGYGILLDAAGDDVYRSFRQTQGRGDYGVGLLWDTGGNDTYDCWVLCQASGEFGLGLLIDAAGADKYSALMQAQGFGGPQGAGLLIDGGEGDDSYTGVSDPLDFPSLIDGKYNVSFVQGAASGVRADGTDGHGLAGGFGALIDGGGDNTFSAGFFAQGIAYWYGVGWLSSGTGRDKYFAVKYAQGAATHFGVGILQDTGGNDDYTVVQELGMGHGHDFGVGILLDESGDDHYHAPGFSLGCASAQGIGIFWDRAGDDTYESKEKQTLGCANMRIDLPSLRVTSRTIGVFLDSGGKNEFKAGAAGVTGTKTSGAWRHSPEFAKGQTELPARMQDRLLGVGRVVNEPKTDDPL